MAQIARLPRHIAVTTRSENGRGFGAKATLTLAQLYSGQVFNRRVVKLLQDGAGAVEYNRNAPITLGHDPKLEQGAFYYVLFPQDVEAIVLHCEMYHAFQSIFGREVRAQDVIDAIQAGRLVMLPEGDTSEAAKAPAEEASKPATNVDGQAPVVVSTNGDGPSVTAFGTSTRKGKKTD